MNEEKVIETETTDLPNEQTTEETEVKETQGNDNKENKEVEENVDLNSEIYGSPEKFDYSETVLPEGMEFDQDLIAEFEPIARELNLSNQSANKLMGLAVKLAEKNFSKLGDLGKQIEEQEKASYIDMLNSDKELNISDNEKYDTYLNIANQGLKAVATKGFMDVIKKKGLTYHPEFIKTFHKIGKLCSEDNLPEVKIPAGQEKADAADILYAPREKN